MKSKRTVHDARLTLALFAASLISLSGCAARAPVFETSEKPPEEKAPSPLIPLPVKRESARGAQAPVEAIIERFFLGLATGAMDQVAPLLSPDAVVRRGPSGAQQPARGELKLVSADWSVGGSVGSPGTAGQLPPLGLVRTTQIDSSQGSFFVTVAVDGPSAVQGKWKLRIGETSGGTAIEEITLPAQR